MSTINDGGPAFPHQDSGDTATRPGMSLRDYFAAKATEEDVAYWQNHYVIESTGKHGTHDGIMANKKPTREEAKFRYAYAMLAARESQP